MANEFYKLKDFLEVEKSGHNKMFCPYCGVKGPVPKDGTPDRCKNCGMNFLVKNLTLETWRNS